MNCHISMDTLPRLYAKQLVFNAYDIHWPTIFCSPPDAEVLLRPFMIFLGRKSV